MTISRLKPDIWDLNDKICCPVKSLPSAQPFLVNPSLGIFYFAKTWTRFERQIIPMNLKTNIIKNKISNFAMFTTQLIKKSFCESPISYRRNILRTLIFTIKLSRFIEFFSVNRGILKCQVENNEISTDQWNLNRRKWTLQIKLNSGTQDGTECQVWRMSDLTFNNCISLRQLEIMLKLIGGC